MMIGTWIIGWIKPEREDYYHNPESDNVSHLLIRYELGRSIGILGEDEACEREIREGGKERRENREKLTEKGDRILLIFHSR